MCFAFCGIEVKKLEKQDAHRPCKKTLRPCTKLQTGPTFLSWLDISSPNRLGVSTLIVVVPAPPGPVEGQTLPLPLAPATLACCGDIAPPGGCSASLASRGPPLLAAAAVFATPAATPPSAFASPSSPSPARPRFRLFVAGLMLAVLAVVAAGVAAAANGASGAGGAAASLGRPPGKAAAAALARAAGSKPPGNFASMDAMAEAVAAFGCGSPTNGGGCGNIGCVFGLTLVSGFVVVVVAVGSPIVCGALLSPGSSFTLHVPPPDEAIIFTRTVPSIPALAASTRVPLSRPRSRPNIYSLICPLPIKIGTPFYGFIFFRKKIFRLRFDVVGVRGVFLPLIPGQFRPHSFSQSAAGDTPNSPAAESRTQSSAARRTHPPTAECRQDHIPA